MLYDYCLVIIGVNYTINDDPDPKSRCYAVIINVINYVMLLHSFLAVKRHMSVYLLNFTLKTLGLSKIK